MLLYMYGYQPILEQLMSSIITTEISNRISFWQTFEFFSLAPRLGRIKFLGLISFWFGLFFLFGLFTEDRFPSLLTPIVLIIFLPNFLAVITRRLHDMNLSAWWILIAAAPIVGSFTNAYLFWFSAKILPILVNIVLCFVPGTKNANKFGARASSTEQRYYFLLLSTPIAMVVYSLIKRM